MSSQLHLDPSPPSPLLHLPAAERTYLNILTSTLHDVLTTSLSQVFLIGSAISPAYTPGLSDLDLVVLITRPRLPLTYTTLISLLSHSSFPCPARKLELTIYTVDAVKRPERYPAFEMSFSTGAGMKRDQVMYGQSDIWKEGCLGFGFGFWFLLDVARARTNSVKIWGEGEGKEAGDVFGEVGREWVIDALCEGVRFYKFRLTDADSITEQEWEEGEKKREVSDAVLNACRGWMFSATGKWAEKVEGAEWVKGFGGEGVYAKVARKAVKARCGEGDVGRGEAMKLLGFVEGEIGDQARKHSYLIGLQTM